MTDPHTERLVRERLEWAEAAISVPERLTAEDDATAAADLAVNLAHLIRHLTGGNGADRIRAALDLHYDAEEAEADA